LTGGFSSLSRTVAERLSAVAFRLFCSCGPSVLGLMLGNSFRKSSSTWSKSELSPSKAARAWRFMTRLTVRLLQPSRAATSA
ncbi:hypothetical protein FPV67DRAFT_1496110, partial [Lyophyllum atratum]